MRFLIALLFFSFAAPAISANLSAEDIEFLRELGDRYRFGLDFEITKPDLSRISWYYSDLGLQEHMDLQRMLERPTTAVLRKDAPEEIRNVLQYFSPQPSAHPDRIWFALREEAPASLQRDPFKIIELQEQFAQLVNIGPILSKPFGPYTGVSIDTHISRYQKDGSPNPFSMAYVLAQYDSKAALIYDNNAEDIFTERGISIFVSRARPQDAERASVRDLILKPFAILFEPAQIFDQNLITNLRGPGAEEIRAAVKHNPETEIETLAGSNWLEDKGRVFEPTKQLIWTLKILEGRISLAELYDRVAFLSMNDGFILHIMLQLQYEPSRKGLAVGLLYRTARHTKLRRELVSTVARALRALQAGAAYQTTVIPNFLLSATNEVDRQFALDCLDESLRQEPRFIRSIATISDRRVTNFIGKERLEKILSHFTQAEQNAFHENMKNADCADELSPPKPNGAKE